MTGREFLAFCLAPILGVYVLLAVVFESTVTILSVPILFIVSVGIMTWWTDRA